jgi:serine/threonine-protein kinase
MYGQIAVGGMATVHLGRLTGPAGFSRTVAIKCPHPQYAKDPEFAAMFLDEARLAARVNHPNVVAMLDVVMVDDELFLVMEYVLGASLAHVLRRLGSQGERLPPAVTSTIVGDMLRGLHAAHEAKGESGESLNIVHRDVSPQNVLVGVDGVARLLDFGVAKAVGRLQTTRDGKIKGKLSYMAPEQISGKRVSRRADVYSAAVVLWQTLTGRRLFEDDAENGPPSEGGIADSIGKVLFARVPPPSEFVPTLPPGLDQVVMRGLDRDPANRYQTALQMAVELHRCVPPAPPGDVAAAIVAIVGNDIDEASARITNIERSEAGVEATVAIPVPVSELPTTPEGRAAVDVTTTTLSVTQRWPGRSRWGRSRRWVALGATGVALGALGLGLRAWRAGPPAFSDGVVSPEVPAVVVPVPPPETRPDSTTPRPDPSASPAAGGATSEASSPASAAPLPRTFVAGHAPSAPRSSTGNCSIVWRADAAGILHPVRECK